MSKSATNKVRFVANSFRSLVVCLATSVLVACGAAVDTKPTVLLVLKTLDNPFFVDIREGVADTLSDDYELIVRSGANESDLAGQRRILEAFLPQFSDGRGAVIISPSASGGELVPQLAAYRSLGVPVILVDTGIAQEEFRRVESDYNAVISSDNFQGGELAGQTLARNLAGSSAGILLLQGAEGSATAEERASGFIYALRNIELNESRSFDVLPRMANWRRNEAREVVETLIAGGRRFDGIFAANDNMALGAIAAYEAAGLELPIIVGFDAINEAREAVESGEMTATIAQSPRQMGVRAASLVLEAQELTFHNEPVEVELVESPGD